MWSITAYRRTRRQLCSLAYELATTWCYLTFAQRTQSELSHKACTIDDHTINIVLGIIIIIIIIINTIIVSTTGS